MQYAMLVSFLIYVTVVVFIGLWASKKQESISDESSFIVGGRSLNFWVTALSAHASDMSQWLLMGYPAVVYAHGMIEAWTAIGLVCGMFLMWHYVAPALRIESERYHAYTISSFFEKKTGDTSGLIRVVSAFLCLFFFTVYIASGVKAFGYLLSTVLGLPYWLGACSGVAVIVLYTCVGGFVAAAWTDSFQALFLLSMAFITPLVGYFSLSGGMSDIYQAAHDHGVSLSLVPDVSRVTLLYIVNSFAWILGYFGMPHILTKFMGARDAKEMHKSKYVGIVWQIAALGSAIAVGLVGLAQFKSLVGREEFIFIDMATQLFSPWFAGFVLTAILAAIVSTMDSQILVVAGVIAEDFYRSFYNKKATQAQVKKVFQGSLVLVAFLALSLSFNETNSIYELVKYAWSGLGCAFGPLMILTLFSKRVTPSGALTGMILGGLAAALWPFFDHAYFHTGLTEMLPGFVLGLLIIGVVSRINLKD